VETFLVTYCRKLSENKWKFLVREKCTYLTPLKDFLVKKSISVAARLHLKKRSQRGKGSTTAKYVTIRAQFGCLLRLSRDHPHPSTCYGNIFYAWSRRKKRFFEKKIYESLPPLYRCVDEFTKILTEKSSNPVSKVCFNRFYPVTTIILLK
jgi:hypothetical protein